MRRILVLALVAAVVTTFAPVGNSSGPTLALVHVKVTDAAMAQDLMTNFDETHNHRPGRIEILAWPGDIERLETRGYSFSIVEDDVIARDQELFEEAPKLRVPLPGPDRSNYRTLPDYNTEMKTLAKKNPKLVKLLKGKNITHEGRTVFALEIAANVKRSDGRPTFYVDGIHHAREWPAGEYPMIFAHYLVEKFGKSRAITKLLRKVRVVIVPVVNPDGFDYSRSSVLTAQANVDAIHGNPCGLAGCEGYWRKNRRSFTGVTVPVAQKNPDAYGVDPNRNYSWNWGGGGASPDEASQTHHGHSPFSEPESRNVEQIVLSHNVTSLISNHTSGRLVLRPWGDTSRPSPDERWHRALGQKYSDAMRGYQNIKGIQLYVTTGTTSDWGYGVLGIPSYTFEHGRAFHPPYSGCQTDCVAKEWPGVMKAYVHGARAALNLKGHGLLRGRVRGGRATLTVTRKIATPLSIPNPETGKRFKVETIKTTMKTRGNGSFAWHLPATKLPWVKKSTKYTLKVKGKGGTVSRRFSLRRGQRLSLGAIRL